MSATLGRSAERVDQGRTATEAAAFARPVLLIAGLAVVGLLALAGAYGFHRDELYFVIAGRHPAFGYVDQPSITPLLSAASVALLGVTPVAIRILPAMVIGACIVLAALTARDLGGSRRAQVLAAATLAVSGYLAAGHLDSTTTFDLLAWAVVAWLVVRLLAGGDRRLWLAVGVAAGIGLENKHILLFLGASLAAGLVAARRWDVLRSPWAWAAVGLALVIWAPNLAWQASRGFPQLEMARQIGGGGLGDRIKVIPELLLLAGPFLFPFSLAGAWWLLRNEAARPWRAVGWAAVVLVLLVLAVSGKSYYAAGMLMPLMAAGAIALDHWLGRGRPRLSPRGGGCRRDRVIRGRGRAGPAHPPAVNHGRVSHPGRLQGVRRAGGLARPGANRRGRRGGPACGRAEPRRDPHRQLRGGGRPGAAGHRPAACLLGPQRLRRLGAAARRSDRGRPRRVVGDGLLVPVPGNVHARGHHRQRPRPREPGAGGRGLGLPIARQALVAIVAGAPAPQLDEGEMNQRYDAIVQELTEAGERAARPGLVLGSAGNLSARGPGPDEMVITSTGSWLDRLRPAEFCVVGFDGCVRHGAPAPSIEWRLHLQTYLTRPDVNAVVHLHPPTAVLLDALGHELRLITRDQAYYLGSVARVPYLPAGSPELANAVSTAACTSNAILMAFHGSSTLGDTVAMALRRALNLEDAALATFRCLQLGNADLAFPAEWAAALRPG